MNEGWLLLLDMLAVVLVLILLAGVALIVRRRLIARDGGTFELSFRLRQGDGGRGWALGVGRYYGERLQWFRFFSFSMRPQRSWERDDLEFLGRREQRGMEQSSLYGGDVVVECSTVEGPVEMALSESSLMGLQAWLEAGPPGTNWDSRPVR